MAFRGYGVWSLVGQQQVTGLALSIGLTVASGWRPGNRVSRRHLGDLFGFGVSVLGTNVVSHVARRSDDFFVGAFLGPTQLGFYAVGYRVLRILTRLLTQTINAVAFPVFSRLQEDRERMLRGFYRVTQMNSLIAFPVFAGVAAVAPDLVAVLFGDRWARSVPVMQVLCLVGLLHSVSYFQSAVIAACGKPSWRFGLMLLNALGNVVAFWIAVRWGITAVAIAYAIRVYAFWPIQLFAVHRLLPFRAREYFGAQGAALSGSVVMLGGCLLVRGALADLPAPLSLAAQVAAGVVLYVGAVRLLAPGQYTAAKEMISSLRGSSEP
jgi:PST family polysaccharide transporter